MSQFVATFEEILDAEVFDEEAADEVTYQFRERQAEGYVPTPEEFSMFNRIEDRLANPDSTPETDEA